ncbi:protein diaphanous homolog 1 isoform X2 [Buteo buteo]|uniref:protein diaphanous homolog 1 isoform X2 n=1 Tax=Buteo buteo TaxID=30397 RepID=UPI003EBE22D7
MKSRSRRWSCSCYSTRLMAAVKISPCFGEWTPECGIQSFSGASLSWKVERQNLAQWGLSRVLITDPLSNVCTGRCSSLPAAKAELEVNLSKEKQQPLREKNVVVWGRWCPVTCIQCYLSTISWLMNVSPQSYKNGADPNFRCKHLDMNPEQLVAGLGTDCMEELQIEMKVAKRDFEEKLLDARGGKEMLDLGKQQMTAEKQDLASKVSHLNGEAERTP